MYEQKNEADTAKLAMILFRLGLLVVFIVMVGRLFQLQILQGKSFQTAANDNRLEEIESPAPRGVIYDRQGVILTRNKPSFEIAIVPEDLPSDDDATAVDERGEEIARILQLLGVEQDPDTALRIAEVMFRRLQRRDYAETVEGVGIKLDYSLFPGPAQPVEEWRGGLPAQVADPIPLPQIAKPLPLPGLVALVKRAVAIGELGGASDPVPILDLVDLLQAQKIAEETYRLPAIRVNEVPVREYVYRDLFSHVLGFMGPIPASQAQFYKEEKGFTNPNEKIGLNGLEASYQDELRGRPGHRTVEVDILGREVRTVGEVREAVAGLNLTLNIDLRLQRVMRDSLQVMMDQKKSKWAVAIAMNPQNGAVLGMVSLPGFDNNIFAERIDEDYLKLEKDERKPLINYAIGGLYPPGSTFKMVTATGALAEGIIDRDSTIVDSGPILLPNIFFPNDLTQAQKFVSWNHKLGIVHGPVNIVQGLALSNDIYFYYLGGGYPPANFKGLKDKNIAKWAELYGYGAPTGIDLPGEVGGLVPTDQWKRKTRAEVWTTGDSYNIAIGQGDLLATPLQVLVSAATVANGGTVYVPQVVYQMKDADGQVQHDYQPTIVRQLPTSAENILAVQEGMWAAVNSDNGTAVAARINGVTVAGKTGTAEYCKIVEKEPGKKDCYRDEHDNSATHAWFVAYAPYENPEIAVLAFVYDGGEGSATALPVVKTIMEAYFSQISPPPQQQG